MIKVKVIDENHEKDLENSINTFIIQNDIKIIDIKFSTTCALFSDEQIYCFSALIIYENI